jgi:hypothetical protein
MRLDQAFVRLPLRVDAARLHEEIAALGEDVWRDHPEGAPGNSAVPLLAVGGDPQNETTKGPMAPTPVLAHLPYTRQVLAALGSTIGRSRLMRIEHETELSSHVDINHYWWRHLRVHVPVVTTPDVMFEVGGQAVHMSAGDVWVFDTWRRHRVANAAATPRIHLVVDTVGGPGLWDMIRAPEREHRPIDWAPDALAVLPLETANWPVVMAPAEVDTIIGELLVELATVDAQGASRAAAALTPFRHAWRDCYAQFGVAEPGWRRYRELVGGARATLTEFAHGLVLSNDTEFARAVEQLVLVAAVSPDVAAPTAAARPAPPATQLEPLRARLAGPPRISQPIFIVSPPRSGSSLLFETLARAPGIYTVGGESHEIIEGIAALTPETHDWSSNRLDARDATDGAIAFLKDAFVLRLREC